MTKTSCVKPVSALTSLAGRVRRRPRVLRYPRSVGAFDPSSPEYVVLVSGGWLE